jgi:membrane protein
MATNEDQERQSKPLSEPQSSSGEQEGEKSQTKQASKKATPVQKIIGPLLAFFKKFANDWTLNLQASALAYNLVVAILPILVALFLLFGLILGSAGEGIQKSFINAVASLLPQGLSRGIVEQLIHEVQRSAGTLGFIVLLTALFGGSRLFILLENCFDLIYHSPPRRALQQNMMAIGMLLLFAVLVPIMLAASSIPALLISFLKTTFLQGIPGGQFLFSALGILTSLVITWVLFETIYLIVPNQHVSLRDSWGGAVIATLGLQIYLVLFPFYATHFLNGYAGQAGFAVILLVFFYYFALILLLGAEFNAFVAEKIQKKPNDLASLVHKVTSLDQKPPEEQHLQATPPHKHDMDSD